MKVLLKTTHEVWARYLAGGLNRLYFSRKQAAAVQSHLY